jgi:hypothetical protein
MPKKLFEVERFPPLSPEDATLLEKIIAVPPPPAPEKIAEKIGAERMPIEEDREEDYDLFEIDLSTPHTDEPLGLATRGIVATSFYIEKAPAPFQYKVNSKARPARDAAVGKGEQRMWIKEIYYSNEAAGADLKAQIVVYYKRKYMVAPP